ncbi:Structural maintenance of chromosome0s protein 4 [Vanrija pseudolonga]|uniref:Structural maintenance of chromosomes protein n=1 Tax=Vanrija pseudolonga TaxID=143232 RepID=A0AAF1BF69_9TREE|nr:Structural maintenance of chromosome0s protein 4 [Vanrija pseudolonga]
MPPRRSTRAASTATEAPPAPTRSSRTRKVVPASPTPEAEDASDHEEAPVVKKAPAKRASTAKAKTPAPAPKRRSGRAAAAGSPTPEPAVKAEPTEPAEEEEADSAPTSPEKAAPKAAKSKRRVVESSDSEEELEDLIPAATKAASPKAPTPNAEIDDAPTPTPDTPQDPTARESSKTPVPETPKKQNRGGESDAPISPDSSPDMAHVLPPKTPARGAAPRQTLMATPAAPPPATGPKPRLVIHKLVLVNFKSYAGRQEIGPFHKSFSAIVGPNGSGKSNTIDALLFVFGYRASKMRQGKLSELIHNSAGKEGLESCSVEVWFREIVDLPGVDDFLLVPNSQLVVNRTAFRNNSSRYTINDRNSTFTEVTTLLKGKGIDLDHNRFLILQGEVESIALMKAKAGNEHEDGLLEYLEDIIGTTKYKEPIEQASLEVEGLSEERGEKMNRLRVVEREKASLEDKKREAESFLRDTNDLTRKKSLLWQFHMYTLQNNIELTTKAIDSLTAELSEEQERNAHHLAQIEDLQKDHDEKLATFEEVKRLTDALVKDTKRIEKEEVALQEKKKHLSTKQKKLKKSIQDDSHAKSEAHVTAENCAGEIESNRKKVTELEKKLEVEEAELEEVRDSLKDKTDEFTTKIEAKQRELEPWTAKISEKQSAIDVAQSERDLLAGKATTAQTALEEARKALKDVEEGASAKQEEYKALKKEAVQAKKQLADAESRLQTLTSQFEELRTKASSARQKVDEAKASLAADKSENAVLASLNKLKAQGRIKGFHGRLGDLGVIDEKYDVAVTTACSALNNLVVDTVEQGQACIEHLRKGNVGRASFMVLDKLPPRDLSRIETPEGVPRLFDLIKPKDPKFAPAFYKGVFNTLVADDLQQAQRIGYGKKRWRVVTLAGQLIDPSGTMSGGGTRVARGGMNSKFVADKVAPEVVHGYEKECHAAEEKLSAAQAEKRAAEQQVAQLRKRLPEIEIELEKIELDIQTGSKRIGEAEKRLSELESQSKPDVGDEKRIKTLDAEIATLTAEADKLRSKSSVISEQIKELQNKILEVGGVKLRAIQSKFANTKGLLDLASEAITKAEVGQAKSIRDAEKLDKAILANTAKAEEAQGELDVVEGDLQACSADLAIIREKVQEAQDASIDVQEALAQSKADLDEASTEVNAFRKLEMDIKQKIEDNGRVQKDSKDKYRHWSKRHEELELVYIDEEEEDEDEVAKPADADKSTEAAEGEEEETEDAEPKQKKSKNDSFELVEYSPDELRGVDKDILTAEITALEEETAKAKPNLNVLHEYRRREAEFLDRARDLEAVTNQRDAAKQRYDDLRKVRLDEFMAGFSAISSKLKEMYQMITMGGNAEIELVDTMDPFSEGVVLSIMPPKKSWRPIANLSGGEKTLASLALVFALHVFKPTPLYFMDEIDAALDFKNVSIVANYIQSKTQAAQFIVISLRNDMFELAHRLVGIYKTSNCTKSIAIDNKDLRTQAVVKPAKRLPPGTGAPATEVPATPKLAVPATPTPAGTAVPSARVLA